MPKLLKGERGTLPTWARMLAGPLPTTAAAMLEFEASHRLRSPLDPVLRARLRAAIAVHNHCEPTLTSAVGDLKRLGVDTNEIDAWSQERYKDALASVTSANDRRLIQFAVLGTQQASQIDDQEYATCSKVLGDEKMVALVLLIAGSNFQDRLYLALGVPVDATSALPPIDVRFDFEQPSTTAAARTVPATKGDPEEWKPSEKLDPKWGKNSLQELRGLMANQKARDPRIRVPSAAEYEKKTAPFQTKNKGKKSQAPRVLWTLVCSGYQPQLAAAWSRNTGSFRLDSKQDRVFEESLFWIVTRSIDCFY